MNMMGKKIKEMRKDKGFTQEALGKMAGVSKSTVSQWEKGTISSLKGENLLNLAVALNVQPSQITSKSNFPCVKDTSGIEYAKPILQNDEIKLLQAFKYLCQDDKIRAIEIVLALSKAKKTLLQLKHNLAP